MTISLAGLARARASGEKREFTADKLPFHLRVDISPLCSTDNANRFTSGRSTAFSEEREVNLSNARARCREER